MAMMDLENQSAGITEEAMKESIGEAELQAFLDGAVVRLDLYPDGRFISSSALGGELVSFKVGKESFTTGEEWSLDEKEWVERSGEFTVPKKAQKISLTVQAGEDEVTAKCFNKYKASDGRVTFYLGPLDGYFWGGWKRKDKGTKKAGHRSARPFCRIHLRLNRRCSLETLSRRTGSTIPNRS